MNPGQWEAHKRAMGGALFVFTIMFYFILRDRLVAGRTSRLEGACNYELHQNINEKKTEKTDFLPRCAPFEVIICTYTKLKSILQLHKINSSSSIHRLIRPTTNAHNSFPLTLAARYLRLTTITP